MTGHLIAWNPVEQREVWNVSLPLIESGGVLATAGNLVFQGRSDGMLCAYRATDGKKLWEFYAGTGIMAPPVTYLLDGVQYITLMVGWGGSAGINNLPGSGAGQTRLWPRPYASLSTARQNSTFHPSDIRGRLRLRST